MILGAAMRPTVFLVRPLTTEVKQWLDANVDDQLIIDEDIPIEHRHVDAVLAGLKEAGFEVIMRSRASGGLGTLVPGLPGGVRSLILGETGGSVIHRGEAQAHHTFERDLFGVRCQVVVDELVQHFIRRAVNTTRL